MATRTNAYLSVLLLDVKPLFSVVIDGDHVASLPQLLVGVQVVVLFSAFVVGGAGAAIRSRYWRPCCYLPQPFLGPVNVFSIRCWRPWCHLLQSLLGALLLILDL